MVRNIIVQQIIEQQHKIILKLLNPKPFVTSRNIIKVIKYTKEERWQKYYTKMYNYERTKGIKWRRTSVFMTRNCEQTWLVKWMGLLIFVIWHYYKMAWLQRKSTWNRFGKIPISIKCSLKWSVALFFVYFILEPR